MTTMTATPMANKYLNTKWQMWFKSLDTNHDGVLSHKDTEYTTKVFTQLRQLDAPKAAAAAENFDKWWKVYILRSHIGDITKEVFLSDLNKEYMANKMKFVQRITELFHFIFSQIVDDNNDGYISEDEHIIAHKAFGNKDEAAIRNLFQAYKPTGKYVEVSTVVDAWVFFITNDNETVPCSIKDALEKEQDLV